MPPSRGDQIGKRMNEKLQYLYDTDEGMRNTIIMGDMNGHVGTNRQGIARVIGEFSIGDRNPEGESY